MRCENGISRKIINFQKTFKLAIRKPCNKSYMYLLFYSFETSDGTSRQETGTLKQVDADHHALEVTGSYKYVAPDGLTYSVTFIADEHGFQPQEHVEHHQ